MIYNSNAYNAIFASYNISPIVVIRPHQKTSINRKCLISGGKNRLTKMIAPGLNEFYGERSSPLPMIASAEIPHVLIADEHPIVRMGLGALIQSASQQARLSEAENGEMVKQMLGSAVFDLVILGTHMPDTEAFGLAAFLRKEYPDVKLLIFTMKRDFFYAKRFFKIGCHGYLNKHSTQSEIINAVLKVLSGKKFLGNEFTEVMASQLKGGTTKNPFEELSDRQFEIVLQMLKKNSLSNIAGILQIQLSTVCTHKVRIFSKLKVSSTADLARLASMYDII